MHWPGVAVYWTAQTIRLAWYSGLGGGSAVSRPVSLGTVPRVTIDHDGPVPVYRQIAAILRDRIEHGEILPGHPVPSEPRLVQEFGVNRLTARKAVHVLADEGLVEIVQGRGAYVIRQS